MWLWWFSLPGVWVKGNIISGNVGSFRLQCWVLLADLSLIVEEGRVWKAYACFWYWPCKVTHAGRGVCVDMCNLIFFSHQFILFSQLVIFISSNKGLWYNYELIIFTSLLIPLIFMWHVLKSSATLYRIWTWTKCVKIRRKVHKFLFKTDGRAPGWLSWLSIQLRPRSWFHGLGIQTPRQALHW